MGKVRDYCGGCEIDTKMFDHRHQYIGATGIAVMMYTVDDHSYSDVADAIRYVSQTYDMSLDEAHKFVSSLPFKVN